MGNVTAGVSPSAIPIAPHLSLLSIIFLIWATTMILMLGSTLFSTLKLKWHLRSSTFVKHTKIDRKAVDIYCSQNISVSMSIGLFPKRVYVPTLWSSLTKELQHSLLRHEIAHIKRKDGLLGALQLLAQAIYFFHPLVWILTRQADEFREMACDDMAVDNSEVTPLVYSRCLVHVAEHMLPSWSCSSASTLIKQKNKLYQRVNYQVKETKMKKLSKNRSRLIWTLLLVLIVPLSWYCKKELTSTPPAEQSIDAPPPANIGKIYGTVTDAETGEMLPGANIVLFLTGKGATSDKDGKFFVTNIYPGSYPIRCSLEGYKSEVLLRGIDKGISTPAHFKLTHSIIQAEKVTITAKKDPVDPQVQFVPYDEPPKPIGGNAAIAKNLTYPEESRKRGIEGIVIINAHVNESGVVDEASVMESKITNECNNAAMEALKKTKWTPAKQRGEPIAVWITIPVEFKLEDEKK
jgi:TonB family protein